MTAALLTTVLSATGSTTVSVQKAIAAQGEDSTTTAQEQNPELVKARDSQSPIIAEKQKSAVATIYTHQIGESNAATLYVRSIPIFTFLNSSTAIDDAALQAQKLAEKINQLVAEGFDAEKINVSWSEKSRSYVIKVADEDLVTINQTTTLADSTDNPAEDALQAANRFRRLLGEAAPITAIANQPRLTPTVSQSTVTIAKTPDVPNISQTTANRGIKQVRGAASWYGPGFHGRRTASGQRFNQHGFTAAHRTLPFGTRVRVTNVRNGRSVVVSINDRGPFSGGRIIDLSAGAARAIGLMSSGVGQVRLEILGR